MKTKYVIQVGDKVKLKPVDDIKRKFCLFEDQVLDLSRNQDKIFKVVRIQAITRSVVLDTPIFVTPENSEIHKDAVYLYKKATKINLRKLIQFIRTMLLKIHKKEY